MYEAERGLFELRQGRAVCVTEREGAVLLAAVESLSDEILGRIRRCSGAPLRLVLTHHRVRAMGITSAMIPGSDTALNNGRSPDVSLGLPDGTDHSRIVQLASVTGKHLPPDFDLRKASRTESAGLALARLGRLLPAVVAAPADLTTSPELGRMLESDIVLRVNAARIDAVAERPRRPMIEVSEAPVPLAGAEDSRFILYREANGLFEHLAVLIGNREEWPDPVPVRVHSACVTGDLFGSLRCDCGEQLRGSLATFVKLRGGVILYLAHEGRSIGLANKLRAYTMQEEGLDTVDSDCALGFGPDERCYDPAVEILHRLALERIELLTNNPAKVHALEDGGIRVLRRRAVHGTLTPQNLAYVRAQVQRAGHWLDGMPMGPAHTIE